MKGKKKKNNWKKVAVGAAAGLAVVSGAYWKVNTLQGKVGFLAPAYEVKRVIDGDTFETMENRIIRLAYINAPEIDLCGGEEAKEALQKLIYNRPVYLKVIYVNGYKRLVSEVYTKQGFVNEQMSASGNVYYYLRSHGNSESGKVRDAAEKARNNKLEIYGLPCTQSENIENPKCVIKGNVKDKVGTKLYLYPNCSAYNATVVELYRGDQWFCTEQEAVKAGFIKAGGCN